MDAGLNSIPFDSEWVELLWSLGEAAVLLDERETARAVHKALEPYADRWAVDGYGGACFGQVADLLSRLADHLGQPTTPPPPGRGAFVRTGHGMAVGVPGPDRHRRRLQGNARSRRVAGPTRAGDPCTGPGGGIRRTAPGRSRKHTGPVIDAAARAA